MIRYSLMQIYLIKKMNHTFYYIFTIYLLVIIVISINFKCSDLAEQYLSLIQERLILTFSVFLKDTCN
jgi:hypothetical protein